MLPIVEEGCHKFRLVEAVRYRIETLTHLALEEFVCVQGLLHYLFDNQIGLALQAALQLVDQLIQTHQTVLADART